MSQTGEAFEKLVDVMRTLRSPDGCPWDRDQTLESLTHFVLEEAHEVVDAIERGDMDALREEIGDHIFEGVFLAQIAAESGLFTIDDSLRTVVEKLLRRHPHVFQENGRVHDAESKERAPSAEAALDRWNALKAQERAGSGERHSILGSVPKSLPALLRAYKIGKRVASVGFEWATTKDVVAKIEEEVAELRETLEHGAGQRRPRRGRNGRSVLRDREPLTEAGHRAGSRAEKSEREVHEAVQSDGRELPRLRPHAGRCDAGGDGCGVGEDQSAHNTKTTKTRWHDELDDTMQMHSQNDASEVPPSESRRRSSSEARPEVGWPSDTPAPALRGRASSILTAFSSTTTRSPDDQIQPMSPDRPIAIFH